MLMRLCEFERQRLLFGDFIQTQGVLSPARFNPTTPFQAGEQPREHAGFDPLLGRSKDGHRPGSGCFGLRNLASQVEETGTKGTYEAESDTGYSDRL